MPQVFVSFASSDASLAERVVAFLEKAGVRCWLAERDIEPAASYPAAITDAIKTCGALLLLLTDAANQSPHVAREVELAFSSRRPILPVRIGGVSPCADLQYFLSRSQWLDAGASLDDGELARIETRLQELLQGAPGPIGVLVSHQSWIRIAVAASIVVIGVIAVVVWTHRRTPDQASTTPATNTPTPAPAPTPAPTAHEPAPQQPPASTVRVNAADGESYVWIPPGQFNMGCSSGDPDCEKDELPVHSVEIPRGLWMARTEVPDARYRARASGRKAAIAAPSNTRPAASVSWAAAKGYCAAIGGRLPTEAEWEYAARGGTTTRYYGAIRAIAWFAVNSEETAHPVARKNPNAFGLYDMLGNVSEWVLDRYYNAYDDTSDPIQVDQPLASNASAVARGGSWLSDAAGVRVSKRLAMLPDAEEPNIGFRCAMDELR